MVAGSRGHRFRALSGRCPAALPSPECGILPAFVVQVCIGGESGVGGPGERGPGVTESSEVRPEVVEAIVGVLKGGDPEDLPPGATRQEKDAAKDRYLTEVLAERSKRDRQAQAWELLLTRSYDEPPTWQRIFDDLAPESIDELGRLYDALPAGAQEEYARRFGVPSGV
jgi:hypothetical protein